MKSMTGYGKGVAEECERKITVELKSVNHRFLDLNIKLPRNFAFAEDVVRRIVKSKIERGHIDIYISYQRKAATKLTMDGELAKEYCRLARECESNYGIEDDMDVLGLFKMPDVIVAEENEDDNDAITKLLSSALDDALDGLDAMRRKEGCMLRTDIQEKTANIQAFVNKVEERAPIAIDEHRKKMLDRIKDVLGEVNYDEARLLNEVAFYTDKVAIDEEIARLRTHIAHFNQICEDNSAAVGKKLDFIVQEMNRETNTIGSKCCDSVISAAVIDCKCEIEKIREQIQNIE
ncbi:MAG: YicC family protein [Clostridia bacterium]|nr:YicC family protein [Clostridia bacterium]